MSRYKISEHKDEIITSIIKNLIWLPIAAIIPLVYKLVNNLYTNISEQSEYITLSNVLIIICIILSITSIIMCFITLKRSKNNNTKPIEENEGNNMIKNKISSDFRFSSIVAELTFDDDRRNITSTIDYKFIVLAESVTELKRDLIWSGSDYNGTKLIHMNGNYELIDSDRTHSPYPYTIIFNEEKKRGELIEFKTETSVKDNNLDMLPQYSFEVKYQIDKLVLNVIAPKGMIKNVMQSVYADRANEVCVEVPRNINGDSMRNLIRYTYEIENPSLLYNYFIEWEFTK